MSACAKCSLRTVNLRGIPAYNGCGVVRMTFSELKAKEVINISDGARLGRVIDIVFEQDAACVDSIVVPGQRCFSDMMKGVRQGLPIKWHSIKAIGADVILVDVDPEKLYAGAAF